MGSIARHRRYWCPGVRPACGQAAAARELLKSAHKFRRIDSAKLRHFAFGIGRWSDVVRHSVGKLISAADYLAPTQGTVRPRIDLEVLVLFRVEHAPIH